METLQLFILKNPDSILEFHYLEIFIIDPDPVCRSLRYLAEPLAVMDNLWWGLVGFVPPLSLAEWKVVSSADKKVINPIV